MPKEMNPLTPVPEEMFKNSLTKETALCIIDSVYERRLLDDDDEKDEFLFSRYADQKAKGTPKENRPSPI